MRVMAYFYVGWGGPAGQGEWGLLGNGDGPCVRYDFRDDEVNDRIVARAAESGLDGFVFTWYPGEPDLRLAMDRMVKAVERRPGFSHAAMLCGRKPHTVFPVPDRESTAGGYAPSSDRITVFREEDVVRIMDEVGRLARSPSYARVDGLPLLPVIRLDGFLAALESMGDRGRKAMDEVFGVGVVFEEDDLARRLAAAGFRATANYVCLPDFQAGGVQGYSGRIPSVYRYWRDMDQGPLPHLRSVTCGWDARPRAGKADPPPDCFPYFPVVVGACPERFGSHLDTALSDGEALGHPLCLVSSWNEWTEGHAVEPGGRFGDGFLEEIARAVGKRGE